jgi:hypothetical protein
VGRHTDLRLHLKTAGTSWLQAVRVIARTDAPLFRRMLAKALEGFPIAAKLYHVAADPARVAPAAGVADSGLEAYLDELNSRQILHITYGVLLEDPGIRSAFYSVLQKNEEAHYSAVQEHIAKHVRLLGVPVRRSV